MIASRSRQSFIHIWRYASFLSSSPTFQRTFITSKTPKTTTNTSSRQVHKTTAKFDTSKKSTAHKLKRTISPKILDDKSNDSTEIEEIDEGDTIEYSEPAATEIKPAPRINPPEISTIHTASHHQYLIQEFAPRIVVVGVGGAGSNAINHMVSQKVLKGVEFVAINTDAQHLATCPDNIIKLQIGQDLTGGLGCGANPDAGRLAAQESQNMIAEVVATDDTHMVFVTAGMGGVRI